MCSFDSLSRLFFFFMLVSYVRGLVLNRGRLNSIIDTLFITSLGFIGFNNFLVISSFVSVVLRLPSHVRY